MQRLAALFLIALAVPAAVAGAEADSPHSPEDLQFFTTQVQPLLKQHCFKCHGEGKEAKGGLLLTSRADILKGGDLGPAVDLAKPASSRLLDAINYRDDLEMPPKGRLPAEAVATLTRWVEMKIPYPASASSEPPKTAHKSVPQVNDETRNFWSFRPVAVTAVPNVKQTTWVRDPIDAFILADLEKTGLNPAPPASRQSLIRRAYYDLLGLPPSPQEVAEFVADQRDDAYERLIDRLLASPHYGERWGRHWLDLVRYAETDSYERDGAKPYAWGYRDYVVRSFNNDKPYDQFIKEQLSGDEMPGAGPDQIIATGFYRLGIWDDEPSDNEQAMYDELDDIVGTVGQVFLGLSINCARCHDHKLDPIPQRDYYRMLAFFGGITRYGNRGRSGLERNSLRNLVSDPARRSAPEAVLHQKKLAATEERIQQLEELVRPDLDSVEKEEFKYAVNRPRLVAKRVPSIITPQQHEDYTLAHAEREVLRRDEPPALAKALCVTEIGTRARDTFVLIRGNIKSRGDQVKPGFPSVIEAEDPSVPSPPPRSVTTGRRSVLANWIANPGNPLTGRVMANRIWQYHFGRGLVRSPNNFGLQGSLPTHPQLLEYLTTQLTAGGWKLKPLHRQIMLSNTYRMASTASEAGLAKDHDNDHFWRFDMRRLEAEEVRDSILAVNGTLSRKLGGPSVFPVIPREVLAGQSVPGSGWGHSSPAEQTRRTIYVHQKRSLPLPLTEVFDSSDVDATCPVRFASTQPTQALTMLNSEFMQQQSEQLAKLVEQQAGTEPRDRVKFMLAQITQREPTPAEIDRGMKFIETMIRNHKLSSQDSLRRFALVAYNINEFLYLD
ncbi:MAG: PSD1 and planctomycete cytochrome C domain-containing protein [Planctomycetes bacterium]|nr:PSD1 and planctomycete cytochrome C domain-containing protein [Planctomycetota bacterium]